MKGIGNRFERFCLKHRNWGIPNLMLYVVLGCGVVSVLREMGYSQIYFYLCFDRAAILSGQVWRLITFIFTENAGGLFFTLVMLYFYYSLGRAVERTIGTFRFTLYYLSGIVLMDTFAMLAGGVEVLDAAIDNQLFYYYAAYMTTFMHLSLLLCYATLYSEAQFYIFFFIPVKAWVMALIYLIITLVQIVTMPIPGLFSVHNLFPLAALANYFLFFGKEIVNVLPPALRPARKPRNTPPKNPRVTFASAHKAPPVNYNHRCVICGRTDASNPELEFRYCSRCNGYFCYCQDHINNHTHVE